MRAITAIEPGNLKLLRTEKPKICEPDQVLIRIRAAGICGSDIHIIHGTNPYVTYPRIIGHEAAGEVEAVGSHVYDLKQGDGVVFEPITYCGTCYACRMGHHNVCRDLKVLGCSVDGVFRDYAVVKRSQVYSFDTKKLSYQQAALCEPYTIGAQAVWRGNVQEQDLVLVHGAGPIGLIVTDAAKTRGAVVIVSEPNESRLAMAKEFGADYVLNPRKTDLDQFVSQLTKGEGVNVIFDASGSPDAMAHATELLSPAGRLVAMTFGKTPIPVNFKALNAKELTILGTRHQYQKFPETIERLPEKKKLIDKLTTHVFPAEAYEQAFAVLEDKNSGAGKVVVTFD